MYMYVMYIICIYYNVRDKKKYMYMCQVVENLFENV